MAFISALWNGTFQESVFSRNEEYVVFVWVGYDSVLPINYLLMVEMYPSDQGTEFAFAIVQANYLTGQRYPIFDSAISNSIIPKSYRPKLREVLFKVTERVVRATNRDSFFMTTFCVGLPPEALEKYDRLCDVFSQCGYDIDRSEPQPGKHFWQMTRQVPSGTMVPP